jgi:hypothetical protein
MMIRNSRSQNATPCVHEYLALACLLLLIQLGAAATKDGHKSSTKGVSNHSNLAVDRHGSALATDLVKPIIRAVNSTMIQKTEIMRRARKVSTVHQHSLHEPPTFPAFAPAPSNGPGDAESDHVQHDLPQDADPVPEPEKKDCVWGEWEEWSECPVSCTDHIDEKYGWEYSRHRLRHPETEDYNGDECDGIASETEACGTDDCPTTTTVTFAPIEVDVPFWVVLYIYMIIFWPCTLIACCMCCVLIYFIAKSKGNKQQPVYDDGMMEGEGDPYGAAF